MKMTFFKQKFLGFCSKLGTTPEVETFSLTTSWPEQMWFCLSKTIDSSEISWYQESCCKRRQGQGQPNKDFDQTHDSERWRVFRLGSVFWNMSKVSSLTNQTGSTSHADLQPDRNKPFYFQKNLDTWTSKFTKTILFGDKIFGLEIDCCWWIYGIQRFNSRPMFLSLWLLLLTIKPINRQFTIVCTIVFTIVCLFNILFYAALHLYSK